MGLYWGILRVWWGYSELRPPGSGQGRLYQEKSFLEVSVPVTFLPSFSSDEWLSGWVKGLGAFILRVFLLGYRRPDSQTRTLFFLETTSRTGWPTEEIPLCHVPSLSLGGRSSMAVS